MGKGLALCRMALAFLGAAPFPATARKNKEGIFE